MPQAAVAVAQAVIITVGAATGSAALAIGAGIIAGGATLAAGFYGLKKLSEALAPDAPAYGESERGRLVTAPSTTAAQAKVYGQMRKGGLLVFQDVSNVGVDDDHGFLWMVIEFAPHEIDSYQKFQIPSRNGTPTEIDVATDIDGSGYVTHADFTDSDGNYLLKVSMYLGTDTQTADAGLTGALPSKWTSNHRGRGRAYCVFRCKVDDSAGGNDPDAPEANVWNHGAPQNITATIRGAKVYDPRLDSTNGGSGSHRYDDSTTWEWSDNPVLCVRDYLIDDRLGMGEDNATIDDALVITQANICEESVTVWNGSGGSTTQERYSCNGLAYSSQPPSQILENMLSSCAGVIGYTGGVFQIYAGAYQTPTQTLDESWLRGAVIAQASAPRQDRYNVVRGRFVDILSNYQLTEYEPRASATYQTSDGGSRLEKSLDLPFTTDPYEAQRLALISLKKSRNQQTLQLKCNMKGSGVGLYEVISVTIDELGYAAKPMRCINWKVAADGGIDLLLVEESSADWTYTYSTDLDEVAAPTDTLGEVPETPPAPTGLTAATVPGGVSLEWVNPDPRLFDVIEVYAAQTNNRPTDTSGRITTTRGEQFVHAIDPGDVYYYWILARGRNGNTSAWHPTSATGGVPGIGGAPIWADNLLDAFNTGSTRSTEAGTGSKTFGTTEDGDNITLRLSDIGLYQGDVISFAGDARLSATDATGTGFFRLFFTDDFDGSQVGSTFDTPATASDTFERLEYAGIQVPAGATWINLRLYKTASTGSIYVECEKLMLCYGPQAKQWFPPTLRVNGNAVVPDPWLQYPSMWIRGGPAWPVWDVDGGSIGGTLTFLEEAGGGPEYIKVGYRKGPDFVSPLAHDGDKINFIARVLWNDPVGSSAPILRVSVVTHDIDGGNEQASAEVSLDFSAISEGVYGDIRGTLTVDNGGNTGKRYFYIKLRNYAVASGKTIVLDYFDAAVNAPAPAGLDDYAALTALPSPAAGDVAEVGGTGAGTFDFDAASVDTPDGGTILAPDDGTPGNWVRRIEGKRWYPEWFSGVAANLRVKTAIEKSPTGAAIVLSKKYTTVPLALQYGRDEGKSIIGLSAANPRLQDSDYGPSLYLDDSQNDDLLTINGYDGVSAATRLGIYLDNIKLNGNKANQTAGSGLQIQDTKDIRVGTLWIEDCKEYGLRSSGNNVGSNQLEADYIEIQNCDLDNFSPAGLADSNIAVLKSAQSGGYGVNLNSAHIEIGQVHAYLNAQSGVKIGGDDNYVGSIRANANGTNTGAGGADRSGVQIGGTATRNRIGSILAADTQGTVTQQRGLYMDTSGADNRVGPVVTDGNMAVEPINIQSAARANGNAVEQGPCQTIAYASTITLDPFAGRVVTVGVLTGGVTFANPAAGNRLADQQVTLILTQDSTGGRAVNFNSAWHVKSTIDASADAVTILHFICDGTDYWEVGNPIDTSSLAQSATGSFTLTMSGVWASNLTPTVTYAKAGSLVQMKLPASVAASNTAAAISLSGIPAAIRPTNQTGYIWISVKYAGAQTRGLIRIGTDGTGTIYRGDGPNSFDGGGSSEGIQPCEFTYYLD